MDPVRAVKLELDLNRLATLDARIQELEVLVHELKFLPENREIYAVDEGVPIFFGGTRMSVLKQTLLELKDKKKEKEQLQRAMDRFVREGKRGP